MPAKNRPRSTARTCGCRTETLEVLKDYVVSIKGPLTTPVGGGIRSLNVALRQELDLYVCLRPVRYFKGVPSPVREPEKTDMVIFRENSEDIYAGIEWQEGSDGAKKLIDFLIKEMGVKKIRFPETSGIGIKPVSREGTERLVRKAIQYAIDNDKPSVTIVHKGNIMKYTEGGFRDWAYALAQKEFGAELIDGGPWCKFKNPKTGHEIIVKDSIADAFLQQILLRPNEYSVIATLNLNGDYISDALAAQVGGIGIAPGANLSDSVAMFEATHGTAPKYAGKDYVNPGSLILSAEMMLRHMGWTEAADLIIESMQKVDSVEEGHLRLRAPDGRRDPGVVLRFRRRHDREYVICRQGREILPAVSHVPMGCRFLELRQEHPIKKPRFTGLFIITLTASKLRCLNVGSLLAFRALRDFELDFLTFFEGLESVHLIAEK